MSLDSLTSTHTASVYALEGTQDALMGTPETLASAKTATLRCRMVPMSVEEKQKYGVDAMTESYKMVTGSDPNLTTAYAVVWNDKVWRIRGNINSSGVGWKWVTILEHVPQMEVPAP